MGEEEKREEEPTKVMEEEKEKEKKGESTPEADKPSAAVDGNNKSEEEPKAEQPLLNPPLPQDIVLKVYMHCEGCARKVRRCLKGFQGVEDVKTDCRTSIVTVKGEKADPIKVLERVQRKSHRQVELISPAPKPPAEEITKNPEEKVTPKAEEKKEELPVITVVLGVYMHCEACAQEIKKRIQRMKGVDSVNPDLKNSKVTVKGVFESENLVNYIHRRTGKHATIISVEPMKNEEEKSKEEMKREEATPAAAEDKDAKKAQEDDGNSPTAVGDGEPPPPAKVVAETEAEDPTELHLQKHEFLYYYYPHSFQHIEPQRFVQEEYNYAVADPYPPQIFSDENPNACYVM